MTFIWMPCITVENALSIKTSKMKSDFFPGKTFILILSEIFVLVFSQSLY
jgi:hypothetical protein